MSVYTLEEPLEIIWIHVRSNSMSEVSYPPSLFSKGFAHAFRVSLDGAATAVQNIGIHITLECNRLPTFEYNATRFCRINAPVEAENVIARLGSQKWKRLIRAFGKECEWGKII